VIRLAFPLAFLLLAATSAPAETVWLRGRGDDVWIERDGEAREPRDDRKGLTHVEEPAPPPPAQRSEPGAWRPGWGPAPLLPPVIDYVGPAPLSAYCCDVPPYVFWTPDRYPSWRDHGRHRGRDFRFHGHPSRPRLHGDHRPQRHRFHSEHSGHSGHHRGEGRRPERHRPER